MQYSLGMRLAVQSRRRDLHSHQRDCGIFNSTDSSGEGSIHCLKPGGVAHSAVDTIATHAVASTAEISIAMTSLLAMARQKQTA